MNGEGMAKSALHEPHGSNVFLHFEASGFRIRQRPLTEPKEEMDVERHMLFELVSIGSARRSAFRIGLGAA